MASGIKATAAALIFVPVIAHAGLFGSSKPSLQKLEPNVQIALPKTMKLRAYPMPIPGASNYRVDTGSMRIAITGIPLNMDGEPAEPRTDEQMRELALQGAAPYRNNASNHDAVPTQIRGAGWTATYVTYTAPAEGGGFTPFMGATYQCVSSGQLTTARTVFVVTVGSADCASAEHQEFLKALETVKVDG